MKTEGITNLIQIDKDEMKRLVAEVKEIVATIIHLPKEKDMCFETAGVRLNVR